MTVWEDMERLLTEERQLLLDGRINELPNLAERKVTLLSGLQAGNADVPQRIRDLATTNARLLEASGRGIRAALRRIDEARGAGTTRTYDMQGRLQTMTAPTAGRGTRV